MRSVLMMFFVCVCVFGLKKKQIENEGKYTAIRELSLLPTRTVGGYPKNSDDYPNTSESS
jgi:hypothetical protein